MPSTNEIHVLPNNEISPRRIRRRELAQILLAGAAAGFISPLSSAIHPIHKHLLNATLLDSADASLSATNNPLFLSAQRFATLDVLCEAVVPGSRNAQSAAFIDLLLSVDTKTPQQKINEGGRLCVARAGNNGFGKNIKSRESLRGQK